MSKVANRTVTFINNTSGSAITSEELDLNTCFGDNEIVIKIRAAALNPVDLIIQNFAFSWLVNKEPKTYSRDYSGDVVKVGKNVENFKIGDKVCGLYAHIFGRQGTLGDYLILDPTKKCAIEQMPRFDDPKYSDYVLNAAWPLVFGTAHRALFGYGQKLGPESQILVIGASTSVSTALVQIAKNYLRVGTVVGICSQKSFEYNRTLGFDHLVAYDGDKDVVSQVTELIEGELDHKKFDLVFDSVGNDSFFPKLDDVLKDKNENSYYMTVVGDRKLNYTNVSKWEALKPKREMLKRYGPFRKYNYATVLTQENAAFVKLGCELISQKKYAPVIDSVHEIENYTNAFERLLSNRAKGKVVVEIN
ncbi:LADA_0D05248g1_1 [Lachancea dasiensis]|uniref:LADA_0D05248g1_1 n=1 Tax=Lachancea dasiensis TaxID=1072105 RepID=A0A1G4J5M3_9SACH|nr:LADA_0D05248g1_1 [Lachancea dasiensis]